MAFFVKVSVRICTKFSYWQSCVKFYTAMYSVGERSAGRECGSQSSVVSGQQFHRPSWHLLLSTVRQRRQPRNVPADRPVRSHPDGHETTTATLHGYKVFINYEKLSCIGSRKLRVSVEILSHLRRFAMKERPSNTLTAIADDGHCGTDSS